MAIQKRRRRRMKKIENIRTLRWNLSLTIAKKMRAVKAPLNSKIRNLWWSNKIILMILGSNED